MLKFHLDEHVHPAIAAGLRGRASVWELRSDILNATCAWAGVDANAARRGEVPPERFPRLTIVFDEAQNLSREAIEALRFWNDATGATRPSRLA